MGFIDKHLREQNSKLLEENKMLRTKLRRLEIDAQTVQDKRNAMDEQMEAMRKLETTWKAALAEHQQAREKYQELIQEARNLVMLLRAKEGEDTKKE